jgi:hypothetical protein
VVSIAGYILDLVETENHEKSADVTDHPVEDGADVSDNVRIKPDELTFTNAIVSNTPIGAALAARRLNSNVSVSGAPSAGTLSPAQDAWNTLKGIFNARQTVEVVTGLEKYTSMILDKLTVVQTAKSAGGLIFTAHFKFVRIVANKRVTVAIPNGGNGQSNMGTRASTVWAKSLKIRDAVFVTTSYATPPGSAIIDAIAGDAFRKLYGQPILVDTIGEHFAIAGAARPDGYVKNSTYYPISNSIQNGYKYNPATGQYESPDGGKTSKQIQSLTNPNHPLDFFNLGEDDSPANAPDSYWNSVTQTNPNKNTTSN